MKTGVCSVHQKILLTKSGLAVATTQPPPSPSPPSDHMADRGRVGLDLAPNKRIREQHISTVQAIHTSRLAKIGRGNGVVVNHLEDKFMRTRTGAKTMAIRKERVDHIALENKLLVERMKRIITHTKPVWDDGPSNSSIKIDHQSVLRPIKTSKSKPGKGGAKAKPGVTQSGPPPSAAQRPVSATAAAAAALTPAEPPSELDLNAQDKLTVYEPATASAHDAVDAPASLEYSDDFQINDNDQLNPLNSSHNVLEMSRGSNALECSAVSVRFGENKVLNLDESYATHTGAVGNSNNTMPADSVRPKSATAAGRKPSLLPHQRRPSARRPSTATSRRESDGGAGKGVLSRPASAATAPGGMTLQVDDDDDTFENRSHLEAEMKRRSSVVVSISGLARLRKFERIAADNEKIVNYMSNVGAYYSNSAWEEDRKKQMDRMERFRKFHRKKGAHDAFKKEGLKSMYAYADQNKSKIDAWEKKMEGRKNNESLQRAATSAKLKMQKSASLRENKRKEDERLKMEFLEVRRKEKEAEEASRLENEKKINFHVNYQVKTVTAARKGIAMAASVFNRVLVRNEEKRAAAQRELLLLAHAATTTVMKSICVNKTDEQQGGIHASDKIERIRKTLVQSNQDAAMDAMIIANKGKEQNKQRASKYQEKSRDDYLERALMLLVTQLGGTREQLLGLDPLEPESEEDGKSGKIRFSPGKPITAKDKRGGKTSWDQDPLMDWERYSIRLVREGDYTGDKKLECRVLCEVASEEYVKIVLKKCEDEDAGVIKEKRGGGDDQGYEDDFVAEDDNGTMMTIMQRVPKLVIVERETAMSYVRALLNKVTLKKSLLVFEQIMIGSIVRHEKRGEGVVVAVDPTTRSRHVKFQNGEVHRYLEASWHKLKLIKAEGVPHDGLWEKDFKWSIDLDTNRII